MQRVTVTLDDDLMAELDRLMADGGYANRSEAIRDLTRAGLARLRADATPDAPCVAAVVYTYDHQAREVARRVTATHHDHHDLRHRRPHRAGRVSGAARIDSRARAGRCDRRAR